MKKILSVLLSLCMIISLFSAFAIIDSAAEAVFASDEYDAAELSFGISVTDARGLKAGWCNANAKSSDIDEVYNKESYNDAFGKHQKDGTLSDTDWVYEVMDYSIWLTEGKSDYVCGGYWNVGENASMAINRFPIDIDINLGGAREVSGVRLYLDENHNDGRVTKYAVYVKRTGEEDWTYICTEINPNGTNTICTTPFIDNENVTDIRIRVLESSSPAKAGTAGAGGPAYFYLHKIAVLEAYDTTPTNFVAVCEGRPYTSLEEVIGIYRYDRKTIELLQNVELAGMALGDEKYTLDGKGHTLTLTKPYILAGTADITLKNVTVDLSGFTGLNSNGSKADCIFPQYNTSKLTLEGAVIKNYNEGANIPIVRLGETSTLTIKDGGGVIGNKAAKSFAIFVGDTATLSVDGSAKIINNGPDGISNIFLNASTSKLNIGAGFTGNIGVKCNGSASNVAGAVVGTSSASELPSINSVVCDADPKLFAMVSDGNLVFTKKLTLTATTDTGKYTKTGSGETVYGVVRTNTIATEVPAKASVKEMGTYYYKTTAGKDESNFYTVPDMSGFAQGKGYTADLVNIYDNVKSEEVETAKVYAVNFYKFNGIKEYIFENPVEITYKKEKAKDLGKDPAQLSK